ncbi:hypothetical protein V6N12_010584 [Hibiscus sabdariffa]|uniref:Uncharacterized protein n=1 Tax=Hibiscus sabdariffa TaxID=183260 RepID=A0ABR2EKJ9_9ROSI
MNGRLFSIQISEAKTLLPSHRFCYVGTIGEEKVKVVGVGEVSGDDVDRVSWRGNDLWERSPTKHVVIVSRLDVAHD